MTEDIRQLIAAKPFVPFTIHSADGSQWRVPTVDHVAVPPAGSPVFVFSDGRDYQVLSPIMITRLTVDHDEAVPAGN